LPHLKQVTVIGLGLLGGSIGLSILRSLSKVKVIGYTHRQKTREKARALSVADIVVDDIAVSVGRSDLVILATPIYTFESIFSRISDSLKEGCIVTDVGSTKTLPHNWAAQSLPGTVHYIGSHPIAGSEQRGVEYARDDLFEKANCIITATRSTDQQAVKTLEEFWQSLGCHTHRMSPKQHDRVFADVSHLPHITAASLINAGNKSELKWAGKGFIDTSRIASGPANIWADIFIANSQNCLAAIEKVIAELEKFKAAMGDADRDEITRLLRRARNKRANMINYKIENKELLP